MRLLFKSRIKSIIVRSLALTGNIHQLQKRRGKEEISTVLQDNFDSAIAIIRNTKIPGIDA